MTDPPTSDPDRSGGVGTVDSNHLAMRPGARAPVLPEYVPLPAIAKGAVLNEHGYHVWQVERNLYAVTDNVYMSAFLTTPDGVVIRRAVDEVTAASGLTSQVTHLVYSHHHCDHQGASSLFGGDIVRRGLHQDHHIRDHAVDPPRPRPQRPGPPLTATHQGDPALVRHLDRHHATR
jgi:glyoxylase-like metal-dependent hydrolase (beta-lactamase superfamily II)